MRVIPVSFVRSGHLFSPQLWFINKRIYSNAIAITPSDFKKKKRKEKKEVTLCQTPYLRDPSFSFVEILCT